MRLQVKLTSQYVSIHKKVFGCFRGEFAHLVWKRTSDFWIWNFLWRIYSTVAHQCINADTFHAVSFLLQEFTLKIYRSTLCEDPRKFIRSCSWERRDWFLPKQKWTGHRAGLDRRMHSNEFIKSGYTWYRRFIFFISICRSHSVCILSIERSSKHSGKDIFGG